MWTTLAENCWTNSGRKLTRLAEGTECRRAALVRNGWLRSSAMYGEIFRMLQEQGLLDIVVARLGPGRPSYLLNLTGKGGELAAQKGLVPRGGLATLLARYHSPEDVLLVLEGRDLLTSWGYDVALGLSPLRTPQGQEYLPDLIASRSTGDAGGYEVTYVEVKSHSGVSRGDTHRRMRAMRWEVSLAANKGRLYFVLLDPRRECQIGEDVHEWQQAARVDVRLLTTNVRQPGSRWQEW